MEASEIKRVYAALTLRREVDSIFRTNRNAKIVVMGDLNDEPTNKSVYTILQSNNTRKNQEPLELYNLMYDLHNNGNVGSYNYKGTWNMIDNLIVSQDFFSSNPGFKLKYDSGKIFNTDSLKDQSKKGFDGFSDHYPIYIVLTKQ
jgi:predicted extracellular nuclease